MGVFADRAADAGDRLLGSRCRPCGAVTFPAQPSCPRCATEDVEPHALAPQGTLWTWTVQGFRPKSPPYAGPEEFEPYAVGYVDLGGEVLVEGRLVDVPLDEVEIGMALATVRWTMAAADGAGIATHGFTTP